MPGHRLEINGHPTWVDDRPSAGDGGTLLVLHGGLSCSDTLLDVRSLLEPEHRVVAFDRRGHGYTADTDEPFHYEDMATETIGVLEAVIGGPRVSSATAMAASWA